MHKLYHDCYIIWVKCCHFHKGCTRSHTLQCLHVQEETQQKRSFDLPLWPGDHVTIHCRQVLFWLFYLHYVFVNESYIKDLQQLSYSFKLHAFFHKYSTHEWAFSIPFMNLFHLVGCIFWKCQPAKTQIQLIFSTRVIKTALQIVHCTDLNLINIS